jgi:GWxTD domain-containing protein
MRRRSLPLPPTLTAVALAAALCVAADVVPPATVVPAGESSAPADSLAAAKPAASDSLAAAQSANPDSLSIDEMAFRAILSKEELHEYLSVPADSAALRANWRQRFWRRIDPDPTTTQNERLIEHEARIAKAVEIFARGGKGDWDDRCVALVRYGLPTVRVEDPGEVHGRYGVEPPRERWLYSDRFLYMEDRNLDGRFEFGISPIVSNIGALDNIGEEDAFFKEGRELEARVNRLLDFSEHPEVEEHYTDLTPERLTQMLLDGREAWNKQATTYQPERSGKEIPFFFDLSTFRATDGQTDVVLNYLIPLEALTRDGEGAWIERRTAFFDGEQRLAGNDFEAIEEKAAGKDVRRRWILSSTTIRVPPGTYEVASRITDLVSADRPFGLLRTRAEVPDYQGPALFMSDIPFGSAIEADSLGRAAPGGVRRGGMRIVPQPVRSFGAGQTPCLYFEIYGLTPGQDGRCRASVDYALSRQEKKGFLATIFSGGSQKKLGPGVATTVTREESSREISQWITIDVRDLPPDTYFLEARVKDAVSGAEASRKESFVIAAPPG